ncbi:deleted in malignant brain tumors 1 protein-like [Mercenaria mercenaria]|uniref:deleted in malignant brain tumors 1 protein-like n=1 Tax=Mercenaria mercenaria TaxID=6596 RepID=UPI00234F7393|nr:deleted in malignant brain tumors 1 protein-like [Mercenaria mercenaria]
MNQNVLVAILVSLCFVDSARVDTTGTEFLIALLQQTAPNHPSVQISSNVTTSVTLEAPFVGLSRTYKVTPGVTEIRLDPTLRETSTAISFKGIHAKADDPVAIHVVDASVPNMGGFSVLPIRALSSEYMVMSYKRTTSSEFLITSASDRNKVSVTLKTKGNVTHIGLDYTNGEVIHEILDTFQTWQIKSDYDLTGTFVKAEGKVAVFSGSQCTEIPINSGHCDFTEEQVTTINAWETSFIVPLVDTCANVIRILGRDDGTDIKIKHGQSVSTIHLDSTEYKDQSYTVEGNRDPVVVIESSRPVLVAHFTGTNSTNSNCGPSMTLVPAINQFADKYSFMGKSELDVSFVKVIIRADRLGFLRFNNQTVNPQKRYDVLIGRFKDSIAVFELEIPKANNDTPVSIYHETGVDFGAIFYGFKQHQALSFPLGMNMDLSKANDLVRLINGSSPASGRVEVFHQGNWGTVCDVNFDDREANVICRILGYFFGSPNAVVHPGGYYGQGSGAVMIENLQCDGTEPDLHSCRSSTWEHSQCPHSQDVGVDCNSRIRLAGTSDPREGRLEIFYNDKWGSVCDDEFDRKAASIVCSSLGYGNAGYIYTGGKGDTGVQWIDDVQCTGDEVDIAQCMVKPWGRTDCSLDEDVWVACYPQTKIRLTSGISPAEGRLEVFAQGHWHSVCDSKFDVQDATVVCSMLGYKREGTIVNVVNGTSTYGTGSGKVIIDELECTGNENDIADCKSRPWFINSCTHLHDVGVKCGSSVRLVNGPTPNSGRLEVFYKGHWGTVCDSTFDNNNAMVACRQLGFPYGIGVDPVKRNATYGSGTGRVVIDKLECVGSETDIVQCKSRPWLDSHCVHDEDVGIDCGSSVRLIGGSSPTEGRVEVFYQGRWGTVCSDKFDVKSADVICNQLGYKFGTPRKVYAGAHYGQGTGPIVIDELQCSGTETDVQFCISSPWLTHDCTHAQDVGIDCGLRLPDAINATCQPSGWGIQIDMHRLERVFPNSITSDIILGTADCFGSLNGHVLKFNCDMRSCGTKETTLPSTNVYTNHVIYAYHDPVHPHIIRNYNWTVTLICQMMRNGSIIVDLNPSQHNGDISIDNSTTYTVQQAFYSDAGYTHQLASHPLQLSVNTETYVKVYTSDAGSYNKMVVQSCFATPTQDANVGPKLPLITNGCEADPSVHILALTNHETKFKFRVFAFDNNNQGLFIHCNTKLCPTSDFSCKQGCLP